MSGGNFMYPTLNFFTKFSFQTLISILFGCFKYFQIKRIAIVHNRERSCVGIIPRNVQKPGRVINRLPKTGSLIFKTLFEKKLIIFHKAATEKFKVTRLHS